MNGSSMQVMMMNEEFLSLHQGFRDGGKGWGWGEGTARGSPADGYLTPHKGVIKSTQDVWPEQLVAATLVKLLSLGLIPDLSSETHIAHATYRWRMWGRSCLGKPPAGSSVDSVPPNLYLTSLRDWAQAQMPLWNINDGVLIFYPLFIYWSCFQFRGNCIRGVTVLQFTDPETQNIHNQQHRIPGR